MSSQIWPKINGSPNPCVFFLSDLATSIKITVFTKKFSMMTFESKFYKTDRFYKKMFSTITFESRKAQHSFCRHRISLVETRPINYNLVLKGHLKNIESRKMLGMLHIRRSASSTWTHLRCVHRLSMSQESQELLSKNTGDLSWPKMTSGTYEGVTGHNVPIQGVNFTWNQMFESVKNGIRPKKTPFNFLPLAYNGEVAKLTWPWVTSPISKFRDKYFIHTATHINRWMVQGNRSVSVAMTSI